MPLEALVADMRECQRAEDVAVAEVALGGFGRCRIPEFRRTASVWSVACRWTFQLGSGLGFILWPVAGDSGRHHHRKVLLRLECSTMVGTPCDDKVTAPSACLGSRLGSVA